MVIKKKEEKHETEHQRTDTGGSRSSCVCGDLQQKRLGPATATYDSNVTVRSGLSPQQSHGRCYWRSTTGTNIVTGPLELARNGVCKPLNITESKYKATQRRTTPDRKVHVSKTTYAQAIIPAV